MSSAPRATTIKIRTSRRALTILVVVASLAIGFLSIRSAAALATAAAPLDTSPVSAQTLATRLAGETARAAMLETRLADLKTHVDAVESALRTAQARLTSDSAHADDLSTQLATAKAKLAALERSIRDANRVQQTRLVAIAPASGAGGGEHEGGGDD